MYALLFFLILGLSLLNIDAEWKRWLLYVNPFINWLYFSFAFIFANQSIGKEENYKQKLSIGAVALIISYGFKDYFPVDFRVMLFLLPVLLIVLALVGSKQDIVGSGFVFWIGNNSTVMFISHYSICYIFRKLELSSPIWFVLCVICICLLTLAIQNVLCHRIKSV